MPALTAVQELALNPFNNIAHRGGNWPVEQTVPAYLHAMAVGCRWIEVDGIMTPAGFVAFHDDNLNRMAGEDLRILDLTPDDRERLARDKGLRIPLVRDLVEVLPLTGKNRFRNGPVVLNIDCKNEEGIEPLLEIVEDNGIEGNVVACSFHKPIADRLRTALPDYTATAMCQDEAMEFATGTMTEKPAETVFAQLPTVHIPETGDHIPVLSAEAPDFVVALEQSRALDVPIHAWADTGYNRHVDTPRGIKELARLGVRGVITNRPKLAQNVIDRLRIAV